MLLILLCRQGPYYRWENWGPEGEMCCKWVAELKSSSCLGLIHIYIAVHLCGDERKQDWHRQLSFKRYQKWHMGMWYFYKWQERHKPSEARRPSWVFSWKVSSEGAEGRNSGGCLRKQVWGQLPKLFICVQGSLRGWCRKGPFLQTLNGTIPNLQSSKVSGSKRLHRNIKRRQKDLHFTGGRPWGVGQG